MINKTLLFLDNTYPEPYQLSSLTKKAIGGTEASIIKSALILSKKYRVFVAQKFRSEPHVENPQLSFIPKTQITQIKPDIIIVLRKAPLLKKLRNQFPKAKIYLWLHTYKNYEYVLKRPLLNSTKTELICNSATHMLHTGKLLNSTLMARIFSLFLKKTKVHFCYNPINKPELKKCHRDINKLLFFSSPNKGLDQVLECFNSIRKKLPDLKLYVANPGYKDNELDLSGDNIKYLGSLPYQEIIQHLNESLCVFYPQDVFSETFGLIYAEAHAQGTAIIAHDIGSAKEIMDKNNPPINVNDLDLIVQTIKKWQRNYPQVNYNEKFSDKNVFNQWTKVLNQ